MERLSERVENPLNKNQVEHFCEFAGANTNIFVDNAIATENYKFQNVSDINRDRHLVLLNGDKDSNVFVINRTDQNNSKQKILMVKRQQIIL